MALEVNLIAVIDINSPTLEELSQFAGKFFVMGELALESFQLISLVSSHKCSRVEGVGAKSVALQVHIS